MHLLSVPGILSLPGTEEYGHLLKSFWVGEEGLLREGPSQNQGGRED